MRRDMEWNKLTLLITTFMTFSGGVKLEIENSSALSSCPTNCTCSPEISCAFFIASSTSIRTIAPHRLMKRVSITVDSNSLLMDIAKLILTKSPHLEYLKIIGEHLGEFPTLPHYPSLREISLTGTIIQEIPRDAFINNSQIEYLNLSSNNLTKFSFKPFEVCSKLKILDLSKNKALHSLPNELFLGMENLEELSLSETSLSSFSSSLLVNQKVLRVLNLSYNNINFLRLTRLMHLHTLNISFNPLRALPKLSQVPSLKELYASNTMIATFGQREIGQCSKLKKFVLRESKIISIERDTFKNCISLQALDLGVNYYLNQFEYGALNGLNALLTLKLNDCPNILELSESLFIDFEELRELNLRNNNIRVLPASLFTLGKLTNLYLEGNFVFCDCHASKLKKFSHIIKAKQNRKIDCVDGVRRSLADIIERLNYLKCQEVQIRPRKKEWTLVKWGEYTKLECNTTGNPSPDIIWQTTDRTLYVRSKEELNSEWFSRQITKALQIAMDSSNNADKFTVLPSGELLIINVTRKEIGRYKCFAFNSFSNSSQVLFVGLDDYQFRNFILQSILIGVGSAALFLLVTLFVQATRYILIRLGWLCCCCENRFTKKAHQIRRVIETIEAYRSTQLDKLKENYNSQVVSIKEGCYQQMEKLRESYSQQSKNLRELCDYSSQQITGVRDQYLEQVNRIREYSMSQMSRVRENYVFQRNRIRKFSSHQMLRLRETYKYQQKTLNKLLENLPDLYIQSCRTGSCHRADSPTFTLDGLDENVAYYKVDFLLDTYSLGSNYYTPNSTLTRKGKFPKHSRNPSQASSNTELQDVISSQLYLTPRGSIDSGSRTPFHSLVVKNMKDKQHYVNESKFGHRRCYSLSENFANVQLFQLNSIVLEESDAPATVNMVQFKV